MEEDSSHHRKRDIGGVQVPVQAGGQMVYHHSYSKKESSQEGTILRTSLRRNYSKKEVLTSWEGCMSLDKRGDPRPLRRPRHKRKQEREILLMP